MSSSSEGIGITIINDDGDDKPNPEAYKVHMRSVKASEDSGIRTNDYVGSINNTGRVKLEKKKWVPPKPDAGDNAFRNDDWMGSGKTSKRTWKVKAKSVNDLGVGNSQEIEVDASPPSGLARAESEQVHKWRPEPSSNHVTTISTNKKEEEEEVKAEVNEKEKKQVPTDPAETAAPAPESSHGTVSVDASSDGEYEVASDDESLEPAPSPAPVAEAVPAPVPEEPAAPPPTTPIAPVASGSEGIGVTIIDDDDKPNPEEYKVHMRSVSASEDSGFRPNDYVGSSSNTGRVKLQKKGWTPPKPDAGDNAFRSDDWMGSGKTVKRTWKPKSKSVAHIETPSSFSKQVASATPTEFVRAASEVHRRWTPPTKDQAMPPPWIAGSPQSSTSPKRHSHSSLKWKPKPPPAPVNAGGSSDHKSNELSLADVQSGSAHSTVKERIEQLGGSLSNLSFSEDISSHAKKSWQSHGTLDLTGVHEPEFHNDEHLEEIGETITEANEEAPPTSPPQPVTSGSGGLGVTIGDEYGDGDRPNPEEYKVHMRNVTAGEDSGFRPNDFVGSSTNTGRIKLDKKKWTPSKPEAGDNAFRADDWMGSGMTKKKSYRVKN